VLRNTHMCVHACIDTYVHAYMNSAKTDLTEKLDAERQRSEDAELKYKELLQNVSMYVYIM
jgi:hypothetical protein